MFISGSQWKEKGPFCRMQEKCNPNQDVKQDRRASARKSLGLQSGWPTSDAKNS
jgi:hypothetical protein